MIVDLVAAAQAAVFAKLDGDAALKALCAVCDHVPQDTSPPITRVGKIESDPIGGKGEQLEQITVDVETVYRGESRAELLAMMFAARQALDGQTLQYAGVTFDLPEWLGGVTDGPARDGVTYAGIQTFSVNAEPA
ncbi:conserved hypothetical protein [Altererythrobacter sp. B11]|uniref:DUF3168 domain-containing protein n=1 Tax=Altererythrobacter sp. B11 TaxID=2060312 RepID=UPI000DC73F5B|nr:DUF3168 domain-containing protein [Altererythrobacter sp. B11]BBC72920.1 conserved hypothetical protein [Altererythrobacter sp. B11]